MCLHINDSSVALGGVGRESGGWGADPLEVSVDEAPYLHSEIINFPTQFNGPKFAQRLLGDNQGISASDATSQKHRSSSLETNDIVSVGR